MLTLTIRDILDATPRARIVRLELAGRQFDYLAGQAVLVGRADAPRPEAWWGAILLSDLTLDNPLNA